MTAPERLARALTVVAALAVISYPAWAPGAAEMVGALLAEFTPPSSMTDHRDRG